MKTTSSLNERKEEEEKKLDPVGKADADIDNDGDVDDSDEYLKNRRKKISKSIKKDKQSSEEKDNNKDMKTEEQDTTNEISDNIELLTADEEGLSEEFKEKAQTIFESVIAQKTKLIREELEAEYETKLEEKLEEHIDSLEESLDDYLNYAIQEWVNENELAIESSLKTELTESFMASLKETFEKHHINIPDEKIDLVDELAEKIEELKTTVNELTESNIDLKKQQKSFMKKEMIESFIEESADDLSLSQQEKLRELISDIDYSTESGDLSESQFIRKMSIIKETYFTSENKKESKQKKTLSENDSTFGTLGENVDTSLDEHTPNKMNEYVKAIHGPLQMKTSSMFTPKNQMTNEWGS